MRKALPFLIFFIICWACKEYSTHTYYKDFGIAIPKGDYIYGIDVSRYQGDILWDSVASMKVDSIQIDFAFIKITEGTTIQDSYAKKNIKEADATRLKVGGYHFFRPNSDGKKQAKYFLKHYAYKPHHLPPVVDVEETDGKTRDKIRKELIHCLNYIENTIQRTPLIYTNYDFYKNYLQGDSTLKKYPIWIAHYEVASPRLEEEKWKFWQFSDKGKVNSINHAVDFNVFNGSFEELINL